MKEIKDIIKQFWKKNKSVLIFLFCFSILTFGYFGTHFIRNVDGVNDIPMDEMAQGFMTHIQMGRWGWALVSSLFMYMPVPFLLLFLNSALLALAGVFLNRIFHVKGKLFQCLVGSLLICFPLGINAYAYLQWQFIYGIGILGSIYSVYLLMKVEKWWQYLMSALLMCFCISLYQAFLSFLITLLVMITTMELIQKKDLFPFLKRMGFYLLTFIIACVLYYGITQLSLKLFDAELMQYQGANQLFQSSFHMLGNNLTYARAESILALSEDAFFPLWTKIILLLMLILSLFLSAIKMKKWWKVLICIVIFIVGIMAPRLFQIINPLIVPHQVIFLAYMILFASALALLCYWLENGLEKHLESMKQLSVIMMGPMIFVFLLLANKAAILTDLTSQASFAYINRMQVRIEQLDGYGEEQNQKKIYFLGARPRNEFPYNHDMFPGNNFSYTTGFVISEKDLVDGLRNLGMNVTTASDKISDELKREILDEAYERDIYPAKDSIFLYEDIIVIKISKMKKVGE